MPCPPAASETGLAVTAIPLIEITSSHDTLQARSAGAFNDAMTHSPRIPRSISKTAQRPSTSSVPSNNTSTGTPILTSDQDLPASQTNTGLAVLDDIIEDVEISSSSTSSYTSSASNNISTPARGILKLERIRRLAPIAALRMKAASTSSSASSSTSSSSNLSMRKQYRQERAKFEVSRARVWANAPQTPSGYVLLD